jgi:DNA helicase HerA-like ATPase
VYFVTQNPLDIPESVLGQLGNRVQHALRAFTPKDQKAVKTAAQTLRQNPKIDTEKAIMELGVGEALVSLLDAKGRPGVVERAFIAPPHSKIGPITPEERKKVVASSLVAGHYEKVVDRESAFEKLRGAAGTAERASPGGKGAPAEGEKGGGMMDVLSEVLLGKTGPRGGRKEGVLDAAAKSAARSVASSLGREITRGILGSILGGKRR